MTTPKEINDLINELVIDEKKFRYTPIAIPKKYAPKRLASNKNRCETHKYIRFRSNNKTYDITRYYCTKCPSSITIPELLGRATECWKCNRGFTVGINYFPNKPLCSSCRGKNENKEIIDFIDERLK